MLVTILCHRSILCLQSSPCTLLDNFLEIGTTAREEQSFEISFRNQMEYYQFQLLQEQLRNSRKKTGKKWVEEFEKLVGDLQVERGSSQGLEDQRFKGLFSKLKLTVQRTVEECAKEVKSTLEQPQWQKLQVEELANWDRFCSKQEREWRQCLQDSFDAVFKFDNVVKD
jgi:hypothetical protein